MDPFFSRVQKFHSVVETRKYAFLADAPKLASKHRFISYANSINRFFGRNFSRIGADSNKQDYTFVFALLVLACFALITLPAYLIILIVSSLFSSKVRESTDFLRECSKSVEDIVDELIKRETLTDEKLRFARSRNGIVVEEIDIFHEDIDQEYKSLVARVDALAEDFNEILSCNRSCRLPEAEARVQYLEKEKAGLLLAASKIQSELDSELDSEVERVDALSNINAEISQYFELEKLKVDDIHHKVGLLSIRWMKDIADIDPFEIRRIASDLVELEEIVSTSVFIYEQLCRLDSDMVSIQKEQEADWIKNKIKEFSDDLDDILSHPHHTAAGFFGGRNIEWGEWPRHVVCAGATRAGKSLTMEMLMYPIFLAIKSACNDARKSQHLRAFIFDVDGATVPQMEKIGFKPGEYIILNPFDSRRWGWATGKDIVSIDDVQAFVEVLLPSDKIQQGKDMAYWGPLARHLLLETIEYLIDSNGEDWTLWDLFDVIFYDNRKREKLLQKCPSLKEELYLNVNQPNYKHFRTVLNTVRSELGEIEAMAALWHETSEKVSIREFLSSSGVLIIPEHGVKAKDALRKINSFILELVSKFSIDEGVLPNEQQPSTWIVVDEATRIAPIPRFDDFLTNGLKRGISVIFGFQSYSKAQQAFGEKELEAILEQCTMTALLRLDAKSAEWASEKCRSYWGNIRSITLSKGETQGSSNQETVGQSRQTTKGETFSETEGKSFQFSKGGSRQTTKGTSSQYTKGGSTQSTQGTSSQRSSGGSFTNSYGTSEQNTHGTSDSRTRGGSRSRGEQGVWGWFGFPSPEGWNKSSGNNWGSSHGTNQSYSQGVNQSRANTSTWGESTGKSFSVSKGSNWSVSKGTNESVSDGVNWSNTEGNNQSSTKGVSTGSTVGENTSRTEGKNESESSNVSVQISPQKLAKVEPEDFAHFPEVTPKTGLTGVFLTRDLKTKSQSLATKMTLDWRLVESALIARDQLMEDGGDEDSDSPGSSYRVQPSYTREVLKRLKNVST